MVVTDGGIGAGGRSAARCVCVCVCVCVCNLMSVWMAGSCLLPTMCLSRPRAVLPATLGAAVNKDYFYHK